MLHLSPCSSVPLRVKIRFGRGVRERGFPMRNCVQLCIACGLLAASVTRADFIITSVRTSITSGPFAGDDQEMFRIQNDGQGITAGTSKLLAFDVTMKAY